MENPKQFRKSRFVVAIYLSASLIKSFIACNKQVYYRMDRPDLAIQNVEMVIGDIVHKALELHWENKSNCINYLNKEITERLPDEFTSSYGFALNCIENFFDKFYPYLGKDDAIEKRFKIPYGDNVFIVGKMDRVSNSSVFDWKTARKPLTSISGDLQFILYNWAYEKTYGRPPTAVYYGALTTGSIVMYKHDIVADKALFSDVIPQVLSAIKSKDFTPNGLFRRACFRCSYSESCLKEMENSVMDSKSFIKK